MIKYNYPVVTVKANNKVRQPLPISKVFNKSDLVCVDTDDFWNYADEEDGDENDIMDRSLDDYAIRLDDCKNWALSQDKFGRPILIALKGKAKK